LTTIVEIIADVHRSQELVEAVERLDALRAHAEALKVRINECRGLVGDGRPFDLSPLMADQRREVIGILRDFTAEATANDEEIRAQVGRVASLWAEHLARLDAATAHRDNAASRRIDEGLAMVLEAMCEREAIAAAKVAAGATPVKRTTAAAFELILQQLGLMGRENDRRAA
jgi:hypothetical protein